MQTAVDADSSDSNQRTVLSTLVPLLVPRELHMQENHPPCPASYLEDLNCNSTLLRHWWHHLGQLWNGPHKWRRNPIFTGKWGKSRVAGESGSGGRGNPLGLSLTQCACVYTGAHTYTHTQTHNRNKTVKGDPWPKSWDSALSFHCLLEPRI